VRTASVRAMMKPAVAERHEIPQLVEFEAGLQELPLEGVWQIELRLGPAAEESRVTGLRTGQVLCKLTSIGRQIQQSVPGALVLDSPTTAVEIVYRSITEIIRG
jgi:hypothetical protein